MTKERPILFSGAMVLAILDGRKTQTRRVLNQATGPSLSVGIEDEPGVAELSWLYGDGPGHEVHECIQRVACPYGRPGDRLWVRETWARPAALDPGPTVYRADYPACVPAAFENVPPADAITWKPSIHMPRALSRILLEVTGVRVERLNDCSQADAIAEGAPPSHPSIDVVSRQFGYEDFSRSWYAQLWEQINGAGAWEANPWVWVIEFRRIYPELSKGDNYLPHR
ncbi:hypothetical protein K2O51_23190 [Cupriavidus pinatubonensis]|uniref:hypothetical protein n=1 Tax=Cupriavidus pinatubonensis TaxID=248026 RepID=UPI001C737074|nr:hypothetical protein [Cupriavidus pinatubonensis]QYY30279.1 hypothetical protein K2O51_23190 [Cupriavidus pinatubonensis]